MDIQCKFSLEEAHLLLVVADLGAVHLLKQLDVTVEVGDAHRHVLKLGDRLGVPDNLPDLR